MFLKLKENGIQGPNHCVWIEMQYVMFHDIRGWVGGREKISQFSRVPNPLKMLHFQNEVMFMLFFLLVVPVTVQIGFME